MLRCNARDLFNISPSIFSKVHSSLATFTKNVSNVCESGKINAHYRLEWQDNNDSRNAEQQHIEPKPI